MLTFMRCRSALFYVRQPPIDPSAEAVQSSLAKGGDLGMGTASSAPSVVISPAECKQARAMYDQVRPPAAAPAPEPSLPAARQEESIRRDARFGLPEGVFEDLLRRLDVMFPGHDILSWATGCVTCLTVLCTLYARIWQVSSEQNDVFHGWSECFNLHRRGRLLLHVYYPGLAAQRNEGEVADALY